SFTATPRAGISRDGVIARFGAGTVSTTIAP
ncbi:MAG: hypothetical protein JWO86_5895, partial [Myxococcaceae bacterium]|nr:hypothetical protein [Myxococcaceae bacterium]